MAPLRAVSSTITSTRATINWMAVSANTAMKRLPISASANSRWTCSGVSMVSLSVATMISTYWLEKRKSHWVRLEHLLEQSHKQGLNSLTRSELQELGLLYRQAAADLSAAREDPTAQYYARSLNLLLSRAHNTIYSVEKSSPFGIIHYFRYTYPQVFRRNLPAVMTAFLLFVAGAVLGLVLTVSKPDFMRTFLGPAMMDSIERHEMWTKSIVSVKPQASSDIMTNNMAVSFFAFAGGITAGLYTTFSMFFNGMMLGVVGAACWLHGMSLSLWSFVAAHGVLELPAIFIAGGAGFIIARGLLFPGLHSRRDSLTLAGAEALRRAVRTLPILTIPGRLHGFVPQSGPPAHCKFLPAE